MKPTPSEVAIELAGGLVDRRVMTVWSVLSGDRLFAIIRSRKIMREHHKGRSHRFAMVCTPKRHEDCVREVRCLDWGGLGNNFKISDCKCYELCQSYTVMELPHDH